MKERYMHELSPWQQKLARFLNVTRFCTDSIEFKWGYFAPKFGLEITINKGFYYDPFYRLAFCLIWGHFSIRLPKLAKQRVPYEWDTFGLMYYANELKWYWGAKVWGWDVPFVTLISENHEVRYPEPEGWGVDTGERWGEAQTQTFDFRYTLSWGEVQEAIATVSEARYTLRRKWVPFSKRQYNQIKVRFNKELGPKAGSWKGGVMGTTLTLNPGETVESGLRRLEREREF